MTAEVCTPTGGGLINPDAFPVPTADPGALEEQADKLRSEGATVAETGGFIKSAWSGLEDCYSAPEADTLYRVVDPVASDGGSVETFCADAATALETFAEKVRSIQGKWETLKTDSRTFLNSIEGDDDWREADGVLGWLFGGESEKVEEHQDLLDRADALRREYEEAERDCANAINADIPGRTNFVAGNGDDKPAKPGEFEHGYDGYLGDVDMAWGGPVETDHAWWVDGAHAVGDFTVGIAEDFGGFTGMYSSEGWFQASWGDALWEYHEDNLQSAASLVGMYDSENDSWGWAGWDSVGNAWKDAAHAVVPWEEWGERPGYVIGTAILNIGATVGGAALTATGAGAAVGTPLMAWRGSAMLNRMDGDGSNTPDAGDLDTSRIDLASLPRFGNASLPSLNLDLRGLMRNTFGSERMSGMRTLLERLTAHNVVDGAGNHGGGGGSGADPSVRPVNRRNRDGDSEERPVDPTTQNMSDTADFIELMNSPEMNAFENGLDPRLREEFAALDRANGDTWESDPGSGRRLDDDGLENEPALVRVGGDDTLTAEADAPRDRTDQVLGDRSIVDGDLHSRFDDVVGDRFDSPDPQMRSDVPEVRNRDGSGGDPGNHTGGPDGGTDGQRGSRAVDASTDGRGTGTAGHNVTGDLPVRPGRGDDAGLPGQDRGGPDPDADGQRRGEDSGGEGQDRDGWNNDDLEERYRPPEVPEENRTTVEPGTRGKPRYPGPNSLFGARGGLQPNWMYDVPGRGRFYTDGDGRISYIDTHAGEKGNRNPELRKPRPDVTYAVDVLEHQGKKYFYETDGNSRTTHAHGDLQRVTSDADNGGLSLEEKNEIYRADDQGQEGRKGNQAYPGDDRFHRTEWDGGHFIGTGFGGSGHRLNLYAQLRELNQQVTGGTPETNFFALERRWREELDAGRTVEADFEAMYEGKSEVPTSIKVKYSIDGQAQNPIVYHNQPDVKRGSSAARSYAERITSMTLGTAMLAGVGQYGAEDGQSDLYAGSDASGPEFPAPDTQYQEMS